VNRQITAGDWVAANNSAMNLRQLLFQRWTSRKSCNVVLESEDFSAGPPRENVFRQPVALWLLVFSSGILVDAFLGLAPVLWLSIAGGHALAALVAWRDAASIVLLACGFLATGGFSHAASQRLVARNDIAAISFAEPIPLILEGQIESPVKHWNGSYGKRWSAHVSPIRVRDGDHWRMASGHIIVHGHGEWRGRQGHLYRYGGLFVTPTHARNPGERDRRNELRKERIYAELKTPRGTHPRWLAGRRVSLPQRIRQFACRVTDRWLSPAHASLIHTMTWGERGELSYRQRQRFVRTGTAHYLAISGLHLGILCGMLLTLNRFGCVRRNILWLAVALFAPSYAIVCGARTPIARATWLVLASLAARLIGRRTLRWSLLAIPGWAILLTEPQEIFQLGTQLSFLAVAILLFNDFRRRTATPIQALLWKLRPRWQRRLIQFSAQVGNAYWVNTRICWHMAPLVALRFEFLAVWALLLSPLLGPPVAVALATSILLVVVSGEPLLARCVGHICSESIWLIEQTVAIGGSRPWVLELPNVATNLVLVFYACWFLRHAAGGWPFTNRLLWRSLLAGLLSLCLMSSSSQQLFRFRPSHGSPNERSITFVAVGHGLAVVIQWPDGTTWLYDAGSWGDGQYAARCVKGVLDELGATKLDVVVVSHFDSDHYNAIKWLAVDVKIKHLISTDIRVINSLSIVADESTLLNSTGDFLGGQTLPPSCQLWGQHLPGAGDNERSLVMFGAIDGCRFCLTGDLEGEGLDRLLARRTDPFDILLVPHHGSLHSLPADVAQWGRPKWAVISGGWRDRHVEVAAAYRRLGAHVLHTDDGAVRFAVQPGGKVTVSQWRGGGWQRRLADTR
jgi:competence protein ComEC